MRTSVELNATARAAADDSAPGALELLGGGARWRVHERKATRRLPEHRALPRSCGARRDQGGACGRSLGPCHRGSLPCWPIRAWSAPQWAHPAIALTAAGAGIGILDHSLPVAVILAIVGWGGRMGWAVLARARRQRPVPPEPVDPWSVPPPWRDQLRAVVDAQTRFDQAVASLDEGPTRERVGSLGERIDTQRPGRGRDGAARGALSTPERSARAAALSAELAGLAQRHDGLDPAALRHESVVAAQLRAMRRADAVSAEAQTRSVPWPPGSTMR